MPIRKLEPHLAKAREIASRSRPRIVIIPPEKRKHRKARSLAAEHRASAATTAVLETEQWRLVLTWSHAPMTRGDHF